MKTLYPYVSRPKDHRTNIPTQVEAKIGKLKKENYKEKEKEEVEEEYMILV